MEFETLVAGENEIALFTAENVLISDSNDVMDLIANTPFSNIVLHTSNFAPDYFDLRTRKLGDALQKLTNYRVRLAILGDFGQYPGNALQELIYESNLHGAYLFVSSLDQVLEIWGR